MQKLSPIMRGIICNWSAIISVKEKKLQWLQRLPVSCKGNRSQVGLNEVASSVGLRLLSNLICLFDLILYVPSTIFQLNRDRSSLVEPVLS